MEWKNISSEETISAQHVPEIVDETIYPSLCAELKEKCNPERFMLLYDEHKVALANELYADILKTSPDNIETFRQLRSRAIRELGIYFSAKELYLFLCEQCNPRNFMYPYDYEKVRIANELYASVLQNMYDVETLESIKKTAEYSLGIEVETKENPNKGNVKADIFALLFCVLLLILFFLLNYI